jgi:hypothetical protein
MEIKIEYWKSLMRSKEYQTGGYYIDQTLEKIKEETLKGNSEDELFEEFYKRNNALRYCNLECWEISDPDVKLKYQDWAKNLAPARSFELYYGNGVVD